MQLIDKKLHQLISIHAPREGCDGGDYLAANIN